MDQATFLKMEYFDDNQPHDQIIDYQICFYKIYEIGYQIVT